MSCKDEHVDNDFPEYAAPQPRRGHNWIRMCRIERGQVPMIEASSMPVMCNQCDDAPCVLAAGDGSVYKRDDGIVIIDPVKANGRRDLVESCPYGAIHWNEDEQLPQKWIFDAHLLDQGWTEPRCVQVCPTGALRSLKVTDAEMGELIGAEALEVLSPEHGTRPRVYYKNLHLFTSVFVGGSIESEVDGRMECIDGARVTVYKDGEALGSCTSDNYGDFKVASLPPLAGEVDVHVEHDEYAEVSIKVFVEESLYVGDITLSR